MTTIGSPVYCGNSNYPLWLANGAPISSPITVTDNLTKSFTITTTESNATEAYNDQPATTQPYGSIVYSTNGGVGSNSAVFLQTNGQTNLAVNGAGGPVQTFRPLQVTNTEGNFLQVSPEAISFNGLASNALTISDGGGFEIGQTVEVLPGVLSVFNGSSNTETTVTPTSVAIGTYATTTTSNTQDFSGQSLSGPGYTVWRPTFAGITWTTSGGTPGDCGITRVNPLYSSKAVTSTGSAYPGGTAQGAFLGNSYPQYPQPIGTYNGFILPTLYAAQPGDSVTLSYAYAGGQTAVIYVNGIKNQVINPSASWVSNSTTFIATGNDEVEFQAQTIPYTGNASQFNITNITFSYIVASTSTSQVAMTSTNRNGSNYGILNLKSLYTDGTTVGSYAQVGDAYNGITLQAASSGAALRLTSSNIVLASSNVDMTAASNISFSNGASIVYATSPTQMTINGGSAQYFNILNGGAAIQMTGSTIYMSGSGGGINFGNNIYVNSATLFMNNNNICNASAISATTLDAGLAGQLNIGFNSQHNQVNLSNVGLLSGGLTSGGATLGFPISNCSMLNLSPACPPASAFYLANFSGTKGLSMTIPPKQNLSVRNNVIFGSGYTSDSFISNQGFTIPPYCVLAYSNIGSGTTTSYSNTNSTPYFYSDSGFSPSSSTQTYSLNPILV